MKKGSCLCGGVSFVVTGDLGAPDACHCVQCRKQSGHFFASTNVPRKALVITGEESVSWYQSSAKVRRGFCSVCGSSLFWDPPAMDWIAIAFTAVLVLYLFIPSSLLPGSANFIQRLLAFRTALLIPLIYFLGRVFSRPSQVDLRDAGWIVVSAGAPDAAVHADRLDELAADATPPQVDGAERACERVRETWRSFEEFNIAPGLALEALFVELRRDLV